MRAALVAVVAASVVADAAHVAPGFGSTGGANIPLSRSASHRRLQQSIAVTGRRLVVGDAVTNDTLAAVIDLTNFHNSQYVGAIQVCTIVCVVRDRVRPREAACVASQSKSARCGQLFFSTATGTESTRRPVRHPPVHVVRLSLSVSADWGATSRVGGDLRHRQFESVSVCSGCVNYERGGSCGCASSCTSVSWDMLPFPPLDMLWCVTLVLQLGGICTVHEPWLSDVATVQPLSVKRIARR